MKIDRRRHLYVGLIIAIVLILASIGTTAALQGKDRKMVKEMMQKKTTVCVGRLIVELPEDSVVSYSKAQIGGVTIGVVPGYSLATAEATIAEHERSLLGKLNEYDRPSLEKRLIVEAINFSSTIIYSDRKKPVVRMSKGKPTTSGEEGITINAFGLKDDLFYHFRGDNLSSPKYEQNVVDLVKKFESRAATSMPTKQGFCTENGLIHDPIAASENETVTMFASLKSHPDIVIRLDTAVLDEPEESLLSRHANNDLAAAFSSNIRTLGKEARELNGLAGEQVLLRIKETNGTSAHSFMWASPGKGKELLAPSITLELHTGKGRPGNPINSSLSDEAVLQLWHEISSSLKIRPVTASKEASSAALPPTVMLGELVATGAACPQTGYWQCSDASLGTASEREFFEQGAVMPQAVVHGTPTLWQKIRGSAPAYRVPTVWKLVAYAAAKDTNPPTDDSARPDQAPIRPAVDKGEA